MVLVCRRFSAVYQVSLGDVTAETGSIPTALSELILLMPGGHQVFPRVDTADVGTRIAYFERSDRLLFYDSDDTGCFWEVCTGC